MVTLFSGLYWSFNKYLSRTSIKNTYNRISVMFRRLVERERAREYWGFVWRVVIRFWRALSQAFVGFGTAVTLLYLGWGLSLLITGRSTTMTIDFEAKWLVVAAAFGVAIFLSLLISGIITSISDFIDTRNRLRLSQIKTQTKTEDEIFVTVADFEQFKKEVRDRFSSIDKKLDRLIKNRSN